MSSYQPKSVTSSNGAWPETPALLTRMSSELYLRAVSSMKLRQSASALTSQRIGERLGAQRAAFGGGLLQLLDVARREREPDALARELAREFGADALGGAGDGDDLAGEHAQRWRTNFCARLPEPTSAV